MKYLRKIKISDRTLTWIIVVIQFLLVGLTLFLGSIIGTPGVTAIFISIIVADSIYLVYLEEK